MDTQLPDVPTDVALTASEVANTAEGRVVPSIRLLVDDMIWTVKVPDGLPPFCIQNLTNPIVPPVASMNAWPYLAALGDPL